MINPTRRNRNIGIAKQGYGQDNKLVVPYPAVEMKSFFERLRKLSMDTNSGLLLRKLVKIPFTPAQ